jgi:hypothetical protein
LDVNKGSRIATQPQRLGVSSQARARLLGIQSPTKVAAYSWRFGMKYLEMTESAFQKMK